MLPNFVIIGAARSGTTSLFRYLARHPEIFAPRGKELHFFDRHFEKGVDWYTTHFEAVTTERAYGEATPIYMYLEEIPGRMTEVLPSARLIAILRNPVERAYSHYWKNRVRGEEELHFSDAIARENARLEDGDDFARSAYSYVDRGRYLQQLRRFLDSYERSALLVLLFDDLRDDPDGTFRRVCEFLGVSEDFTPGDLGRAFNRTLAFRSIWLRNWLVGRRLPDRLKRFLGRLNTRRGFVYPEMEPAVRAELVRRFEPHNAALGKWLGRDLSKWSRLES